MEAIWNCSSWHFFCSSGRWSIAVVAALPAAAAAAPAGGAHPAAAPVAAALELQPAHRVELQESIATLHEEHLWSLAVILGGRVGIIAENVPRGGIATAASVSLRTRHLPEHGKGSYRGLGQLQCRTYVLLACSSVVHSWCRGTTEKNDVMVCNTRGTCFANTCVNLRSVVLYSGDFLSLVGTSRHNYLGDDFHSDVEGGCILMILLLWPLYCRVVPSPALDVEFRLQGALQESLLTSFADQDEEDARDDDSKRQ